LSPSIKVMEFNVLNTQHYNLCVNYVNSEGWVMFSIYFRN
jgi:hypothetical protein